MVEEDEEKEGEEEEVREARGDLEKDTGGVSEREGRGELVPPLPPWLPLGDPLSERVTPVTVGEMPERVAEGVVWALALGAPDKVPRLDPEMDPELLGLEVALTDEEGE